MVSVRPPPSLPAHPREVRFRASPTNGRVYYERRLHLVSRSKSRPYAVVMSDRFKKFGSPPLHHTKFRVLRRRIVSASAGGELGKAQYTKD